MRDLVVGERLDVATTELRGGIFSSIGVVGGIWVLLAEAGLPMRAEWNYEDSTEVLHHHSTTHRGGEARWWLLL